MINRNQTCPVTNNFKLIPCRNGSLGSSFGSTSLPPITLFRTTAKWLHDWEFWNLLQNGHSCVELLLFDYFQDCNVHCIALIQTTCRPRWLAGLERDPIKKTCWTPCHLWRQHWLQRRQSCSSSGVLSTDLPITWQLSNWLFKSWLQHINFGKSPLHLLSSVICPRSLAIQQTCRWVSTPTPVITRLSPDGVKMGELRGEKGEGKGEGVKRRGKRELEKE